MKWLRLMPVAILLSSCLFGGPYTVGGTVTGLQGSGLVLQNSSGRYLSVVASGNFTFPSGLNNNSTYSVTVRTQPSDPIQTCTVSNGTGTIDKADVTDVQVTCTQAARFAYVANQTADTISAYAIDSSSGALVPLSLSPFASSGLAPIALAVDPNGTYLYAVDNGSNAVSVYAIDQTVGTTTSGALTPTGELIPTGNGPTAIAINPTGTYLYIANTTDDTVSAYSLASGIATAIAGSPYQVGNQPAALKVNPAGTFLYVGNFAGTVSALAIDSTTGQLSGVPDNLFPAGAGALSITVDPTGAFLYSANETAASISAYTITSATGQLVAAPGSPLATGSSPEAVIADPLGKYLYAANVPGDNQIATFGITPLTGALTLMSSVGAGTLPVSLAVDSTGSFVYAADYGTTGSLGTVSAYTVDTATGTLTAVPGSPFLAGAGARSIAVE